MKRTLTCIALASLTAAAPIHGQQPTADRSGADVVVETQPVPTPTPPGSNKNKKPKSPTAAVSRHSSNAELKTYSFSRGFPAERSSRPLVIRNSKTDPKIMGQLQEDLAVMARVLEKSASEFREEHEEAAGIPILTLGGNRGVRSIYLEDYGVVFTLTVNLPLRPEAKADESEEKRDSSQNEEWVQARNELFGDRRGPNRPEIAAKREYDPRQVEEFRNALLESLRNAANIRNLRPDDWVTLVIRGRGLEPDGDGQVDVVVRSFGGGGGFGSAAGAPMIEERSGGGEASTMVLRVKKGILDEFARGKGSPEDLRQKISVTLY